MVADEWSEIFSSAEGQKAFIDANSGCKKVCPKVWLYVADAISSQKRKT